MKVAIAQINPIVGALAYNSEKILLNIARARDQGATLIVFPEMALCGYPPADLLLMPSFINAVTKELEKIINASKAMTVIVGAVRENPSRGEKRLYNTAAIVHDKELMGFQDKTLLPDYDVFTERRYFEPAARTDVWSLSGMRVAITICEDIWQHADAVEYTSYRRDPVQELALQKPDILVNLSASPYYLYPNNLKNWDFGCAKVRELSHQPKSNSSSCLGIQRHETRLRVCQKAAKTLQCPVLLCNQVGGNDCLIFDGYSLYVDPHGQLLRCGKGFKEDLLIIDLKQRSTPCQIRADPIEDLFKGLVLGVTDYFHKLGFSRACFGLSGGIDSAVVACIAQKALGKENVLALSLPSRYTAEESKKEAATVAHNLGIAFQELSIDTSFQNILDVLAPSFAGRSPDVTEENVQARIRGMILMAFSNKFGYLLLGTGNKSEMAMGYTTLYGDMCGGLGVLSDVSKQLVYSLAHWINREIEIIPRQVIERPPSAELRLDQKDTDALPEYATIDLVLSAYVEEHHSPEEISKMHQLPLSLVKELVKKIHLNEYKRQQAPPGLRVTKRSFSVGRHFPIVQHWNMM